MEAPHLLSSLEAVKTLIDLGVIKSALDVNEALFPSVEKANTVILQLVLDAGAYVDDENDDGWTALLLASSNGYASCVKLLLDAGADVNAKDNDGDTALKLAGRQGYDACVKLLKAAGAKGSTIFFL